VPEETRSVDIEQVAVMGKGSEESWDDFIHRLNEWLQKIQIDKNYVTHHIDWKAPLDRSTSMVVIYHTRRYDYTPAGVPEPDLVTPPTRAIDL